MAIEAPVAAPMVGTWNAVALGYTEAGFELEQEVRYENVDESDLFAGTLIDLIYRGGRCSIAFESKIYKAGSTGPFWPWGALGVAATTVAPISRLASTIAQALVLTAVANTAGATTPASLTASKSILAPGSARLMFNSKLRRVPVRLEVLPTENTGSVVWFTLA